MNVVPVSIALGLLVACGGGKPRPAAPAPKPQPVARPVARKPPPAPEPPPPPPPPMEWFATARLDPVKGVRMPSFEIAFFQVEGEATRARTAAPIEKLKAGSYHLVVHEGGECGPKANKTGAVLVDLSQDGLVVAKRKQAPTIDVQSVAIPLDGEGSIIGRALVLHADKRGKPGNPVACGIVAAQGGGGDGDE
jgi:hypothetical protein